MQITRRWFLKLLGWTSTFPVLAGEALASGPTIVPAVTKQISSDPDWKFYSSSIKFSSPFGQLYVGKLEELQRAVEEEHEFQMREAFKELMH